MVPSRLRCQLVAGNQRTVILIWRRRTRLIDVDWDRDMEVANGHEVMHRTRFVVWALRSVFLYIVVYYYREYR